MMRMTRLALFSALALLATACPSPEAPPVLPDVTLGDTTVGIPVSKDLHATGGKAPLAYTATGVPAGMNLDSATGALTGSPTTAGDYSIGVTVTDAAAKAGTKSYPFKVYAVPAFASTTLPDAVIGSSYTATLVVNGGKPPLVYTPLATDLPPELTFNASNGSLTGTPTSTRTFSLTVQVADANGATVQHAFSAEIIQALQFVTTSLPPGNVGMAYSQTVQVQGGKAPVTLAVSSGSLPAGLTLNGTTAAITGTPTAGGTASFRLTATDGASRQVSRDFTLSIYAGQPPQITTTSLATGVVGRSYTQVLAASGGQGALTWSATAGTLPPGLTVSTSGTLSGTPTQAGTYSAAVTVTDSVGQTGTATLTIEIDAALAFAAGDPGDAYVGSGFTFLFGATGGLTPYSWTASAGVPAGLTFATAGNNGSLSGTPTTSGTYAFTVTVSDASGQSATRSVQVTVYVPPAIANTGMADGSIGQAYSQALLGSGGKAPYTFTLSAGTLPGGLALGAAAISGTPTTAGASTFTLQVSDANGHTATAPATFTITIYSGLAITTGTLPTGYIDIAYNQALTAVGGTQPYTWSVSGGALPTGIVLSGNTLVGTPTASGTFSFSITATDSAATPDSKTKTLAIVIAPALSISTASLPDGYTGTAYAGSVVATGGKAPYTYSATSLPGGITLAADGVLSGTPIAGGTFNASIQVRDDNGKTANRTLTILVYDPPTLAAATYPDGTVGQAYSRAIPASGGKAPLAFAVTAGSLPAGIIISSGNLAGTPTTAGTSSFTLQVTDQGSRTATASYSIAVQPRPQITTTSLPDAYQGIAYSQTLAATGGVPSLTWSISSGALPSGLSLTGATISGTAPAAGTYSFGVSVVDANGATANASLQIVVVAPVSLDTSSLPDGYASDSYSSSLAASGGKAPYRFDIASGSLPSGLTLSQAGAISGVATAAGAATVTFRVTDANGTTATRALTITVYSYPSITTASYADGYRTEAYSQSTSATGGKPGYTFSVSAGSLPAGLTLNTGTGAISGTATAAGTASFTLSVTDSNGKSGSRAFAIAVYEPPSVTTTGPLPDAYAGDAYSTTFAAAGGKAPLTWAPSSGAPPADLFLSLSGTLSGVIANTAGDNQAHNFAVQVADANGRTATANFSIRSYLYPDLTTTSLTQATVGVTYRKAPGTPEQLAAQYGKAPYVFSASGLPPGLTMSPSGAFSGIPAQGSAGTYTLAVTVTDGNARTASRSVVMVVALPTPRVNGGWLSVAPEGSEITSVLTVFAIDKAARPLQGIGVRVRKNGVEYGTPKDALTGADGKVVFTGLDLNGTTDTVDVTASGKGFINYSATQLNASLVTMRMDEYPIPIPRAGATLVEDDTGGHPILFGGSDIAPNAYFPAYTSWGCIDDLHRFDPGTGIWDETLEPGMPGVPASRLLANAAGAGNGITVLFGGLDCMSYANYNQWDWGDTWEYNSAQTRWTQVFPAMAPSPRSSAAMFPGIPGVNEVYLFGGQSDSPELITYFSDLWRYTAATRAWSPVTAVGAPTARSGMASARRGNNLWICGGWATDAAGQNAAETSECYAFDTLLNAWVPKPALPEPRHEMTMAYKADTDTLYVFGGIAGTQPRNDLLRLGPTDTSWQPVLVSGDTPPARGGPLLTYHASTGQLVLWGGYDAQSTSFSSVLFGDTWTYQPATGWSRRDTPRTPATYTLSGNITGGEATGFRATYVMAVTADGIKRDDGLYLENGQGHYVLRDIPANSIVYLHAVTRAPTSLGAPANFYSYVDLVPIGPITRDTTFDIAFPGRVTPAVATGTYTGAPDWATASISGVPRLKRPNLPSQRSGFFAGPTWGSYTFGFANVAAPIITNASIEGVNDEPRGCEYTDYIFGSITAGTLPLFQFPVGASGAVPGQNPCVPEGTGFTWADSYSLTGGPRGVAAADFLGPDGATDIAVASATANAVTLFRGNNTQGGFVASGTVNTGVTPSAVALANLIGDSNLDLVVVTSGSNTLGIYAGMGTGFAPLAGQNTYTSNLSSPIDVAVADVTGDGKLDIVVLNGTGSVVTYKGDGLGSFTAATPTVLASGATGLAIGKIDNDTINDAAVARVNTGGGGAVDVLRGASTGTFQVVNTLGANSNPTSVSIGDVDRNGLGDIAVGHAGPVDLVFLNKTTGWDAPLQNNLGGPAPQVAFGDFNGDGYADLVVAYETTGYAAVARYTGSAAGTFSFDTSAYAAPSAQDIAVVDANGDGKLDVLSSHDAPLPAGGSVQVLYSQRPLPTVADASFSVVAPPGSKIFTAYRGAYQQTWDWKYVAPVAPGTVTFSFPFPSQLTRSRPTRSGQRAMWDPNFDLYSTAPSFNYNDSRYWSGSNGFNGSQTYGYYRQ